MSEQDLFFDEDELRASATPVALPIAPVCGEGTAAGGKERPSVAASTAAAGSLHSVSRAVALLMTLAGVLVGVIVGLLIPAA